MSSRRSLVIFCVVECLHVCGSGSHSSYVASGLFLQGSLSSGLFQQGSLSVHASLQTGGCGTDHSFILLGVLQDDSVQTRSPG